MQQVMKPKFYPSRYFLDSRGSSLFNVFENINGGQINIGNLYGNAIKAFHRHYLQKDYWACISGNIHIICLTPKDNLLSEELDFKKENFLIDHFYIGEKNPGVLEIPIGTYHGYCNLSCDSSTLLYYVTNIYNPKEPDEYRLSYDIFGKDIWLPENK